jgi:hypothetical protein
VQDGRGVAVTVVWAVNPDRVQQRVRAVLLLEGERPTDAGRVGPAVGKLARLGDVDIMPRVGCAIGQFVLAQDRVRIGWCGILGIVFEYVQIPHLGKYGAIVRGKKYKIVNTDIARLLVASYCADHNLKGKIIKHQYCHSLPSNVVR